MAGWHHQCNGHETWANFGRWWGTGRPGVVQSMGSQTVGHYLATEQQLQSCWPIVIQIAYGIFRAWRFFQNLACSSFFLSINEYLLNGQVMFSTYLPGVTVELEYLCWSSPSDLGGEFWLSPCAPLFQCTVSCGGGFQKRTVHCVASENNKTEGQDQCLCDHEPRPPEFQKCNPQACRKNAGRWMALLRAGIELFVELFISKLSCMTWSVGHVNPLYGASSPGSHLSDWWSLTLVPWGTIASFFLSQSTFTLTSHTDENCFCFFKGFWERFYLAFLRKPVKC